MVTFKTYLLACRVVLVSVVSLVLCGGVIAEDRFEVDFRKRSVAFLDSLDGEKRKMCLQKMSDEARWHKQYTGGEREGVQIKLLSLEQRTLMKDLMRMVLSDYGWKMAEKVALQDGEQGLGKYYLAIFGDPRIKGVPFAVRLCEHHLTIVNLGISGGKVSEFGPILLGANPSELWLADEGKLMGVWKAQKEVGIVKGLLEAGSGISSRLMGEGKGVIFTALGKKAQAGLKDAWSHRLKVFTPAVQSKINVLHRARGGWEKSRVAFYKNGAEKRSKDGGRWDFKCGLPGMVWDFECSRGHIHMSLCVQPLESK